MSLSAVPVVTLARSSANTPSLMSDTLEMKNSTFKIESPPQRTVPFSAEYSIEFCSDECQDTIPGTAVPLVYSDIRDFLHKELSTDKLSSIRRYLWICGRRRNIHPLHWHEKMARSIFPSEDTSLHLVWYESTIYVKPLPRCLLHRSFWERWICGQDDSEMETIWKEANGLLYTYSRLIVHESDFRIAQRLGLLPNEMTWRQWSFLQRDIARTFRHINLSDLTPRYEYGELRLPRLNLVYRASLRNVLGFHYVHRDYNAFFSSQFAWLLLLFAYVSVTLTAFQTSMVVDNVPQTLQNAGYWFGVTVLFLVAAGAAVQFGLLVLLFLFNFYATLKQPKRVN